MLSGNHVYGTSYLSVVEVTPLIGYQVWRPWFIHTYKVIYTTLFPVKRLRARAGKHILHGNKCPFFSGFSNNSEDESNMGRIENNWVLTYDPVMLGLLALSPALNVCLRFEPCRKSAKKMSALSGVAIGCGGNIAAASGVKINVRRKNSILCAKYFKSLSQIKGNSITTVVF